MKKIIFSFLAVLFLVVAFLMLRSQPAEIKELDPNQVEAARKVLQDSLINEKYSYIDYIRDANLDYTNERISITSEMVSLNEGDATYTFEITESGLYNFELEYELGAEVMNNLTLSMLINGSKYFDEMQTLDVPIYWMDESKDFQVDSYMDESLPLQVKSSRSHKLKLYNNTYLTAEPLMFYLESGSYSVEFSANTSSTFKIGSLDVVGVKQLESYDKYSMQYSNMVLSKETIAINAISYIEKNSSYVRLNADQTPSVTPFDPVDKKLNVLFGESFNQPGQEVSYEFEVSETGLYEIGMHYQNTKNDFNVFRTIFIDGVVPFEELKSYAFKPTGSGKYANEVLGNDEENYKIYLTKGKHEITIRSDFERVAPITKDLQLIIDHINQFAIDIRKVAGQEVDENRTWKLTKFIPETKDYLDAYKILLQNSINLGAYEAPNTVNSSTLSYLSKALAKMEVISRNPDELPLFFDELLPLFSTENGGNSSTVTQMIGSTLSMLNEYPFTLDMIYIKGEEDLPRANASLLKNISSSFQTFISSFTSSKYNVKNDDDAINIWVNRPLTHVDTLQKLVDSQFTLKTGIKVKISVMPDAGKLILASAADQTPDVALGLLSYMPFDLAIRNAAYDLSSFDDFWSHANNFTPGAFVPYVLEDNVYALPETLDFQALVYRKDIFENLDIMVPDTWDDVLGILPKLQRYGMNFYHPTAGGGSLKWFYQTSPFIYQYGGSLYSEDGLKTTINSEQSVKGLEFLNDLYTLYSLPAQVPLFYDSFRYGSLPVGIVNFNEYLQIKNAAPELRGQWEISSLPGIEDENGDIQRWYIANGTGAIILKDTEYAEESWEFLKWWTSTETQTTYSFLLQSTYGPEFVWLSSNLNAIQNLPFDDDDKEVILNQIEWLRDVPRTPGQYLLERGISDVWSQSVFNGYPTRVSIDKQVISINREIRRKMIEFGYLDQDGNVLKPYTIRDVDWIVEQMKGE